MAKTRLFGLILLIVGISFIDWARNLPQGWSRWTNGDKIPYYTNVTPVYTLRDVEYFFCLDLGIMILLIGFIKLFRADSIKVRGSE